MVSTFKLKNVIYSCNRKSEFSVSGCEMTVLLNIYLKPCLVTESSRGQHFFKIEIICNDAKVSHF